MKKQGNGDKAMTMNTYDKIGNKIHQQIKYENNVYVGYLIYCPGFIPQSSSYILLYLNPK